MTAEATGLSVGYKYLSYHVFNYLLDLLVFVMRLL